MKDYRQDIEKYLYYKRLYYQGTPLITDSAFDLFEDKLKSNIGEDHEVFKLVGYKQDTDEYTIVHETPMLSLNKKRIPSEIVDFANGEKVVAAYKMDGTATSIIYTNGLISLGKTRGDGKVGKNITNHVMNMNSPKTVNVNETIEVRGESVISNGNYKLLVEECKKRNIDVPKSQRNSVAGLVNPKKKSNLDLTKFLDFVAYEVIGIEFTTEIRKFQWLKQNNFITPCKYFGQTIQESIHSYITQKDFYEYLSDGLVFSINDIDKQKERGFTDHHPKGKIAFKIDSETELTKIVNIKTDVSRTGRISFVGEVEPVYLSGATITNVTLYNASKIIENKINIGATVEITRSGEVIPKILSVVEENGIYELPTYCPSCGSELEWDDNKVHLMCNTVKCERKQLQQIIYFVQQLDMDGISEGTINSLWNNYLIEDQYDLYKLDINCIKKLEGFQITKATNIINSINKTKNISIVKFINALGIDGIGEKLINLIIDNFGNDFLNTLEYNKLVTINGIGEKTAELIINSVGLINYHINEAKKVNISVIYSNAVKEIKKDVSDNKFKNKTIMITGKLSKGRKDIEKHIKENLGGLIGSSVNKNTDFLVCNEVSNSSKYKKAIKLNIPIIKEDELYA